MLDERNGRTIIGWDTDTAQDHEYVCDREADNWIIEWVGTTPPDSVWATVDDHRDDPLAAFRVWPLHLNVDQLPEGTACSECGDVWNGREWVPSSSED